jgi:mannose-6-phosphate isomerase-like protein (cupin superfamily)
MAVVRRVVTGHTEDGRAVVVSDGPAEGFPIGEQGSGTVMIWGRDDAAEFPDDGSRPQVSAVFPPPGGCSFSILELAPDASEFHEFVRAAMPQYADPDVPGMHRTPTLDYAMVIEGVVGLELDDGAEVTLHTGDVVVQNGTRHRWHNRGDSIARLLAVTVGAVHRIEGGKPVA